MKRMASVIAIAAISLATASHAVAETNFELMDLIGKGPAQPFRSVATVICDKKDICSLPLGEVPQDVTLILETVMCASTELKDPNKNGASVGTKVRLVGILPPSPNPQIKLVTNAYMPFRQGETPTVTMGGKGGQSATCTATGRLLQALRP